MTQQLAHSPIGASSMYRWSVCPGSVRLAKNVPPVKASSYAEEGTEAHEKAALALKTGKESWDVCDYADMAEAVQVYLDYCRALMDVGLSVSKVEHRFDLSSVYPGCFGTADFICYHPVQQLLIVVDYKHGAGKPVEVEGNPQLDYYALGALLTCGFPAKRVRKVIVQPRFPHAKGPVREHEVDAVDLIDFRADLINYAKATEHANAPLVPGDHCGFCPAGGVCPALHAKSLAVAQSTFAPAKKYDPAKLADALAALPVLEAFIKNTREFAYAEAEQGRCPPGWKLVAKRATRHWKSEGAVADALQAMGVPAETIYEPRAVRSPAQIEKQGVDKKFVAQFTESVSSGHTLAPETDARPTLKASAVADFASVALPNPT